MCKQLLGKWDNYKLPKLLSGNLPWLKVSVSVCVYKYCPLYNYILTSTSLMMSRGPITLGSKSTRPRPVAKVTTALSIPGVCVSVLSMRWTHEEHVMPVIWVEKKDKKEGGEDRRGN